MKRVYPILVLLCIVAGTLQNARAAIPREPFGTTRNGEVVELYTLRNANGLTAKVMTYGAVIYSFEAPDKQGRLTNLTANRPTLADYEDKSPNFGAPLGRYANRIANARFQLDGKDYNLTRNHGENILHGGTRHFGKRVWQAEPFEKPGTRGLRLTLTSPDGDEGFPGTLKCALVYELNDANEWRMAWEATTDKATHFNVTHHGYWNLAGAYSGDVLDQVLTVNAGHFLAVDEFLIPTGEIRSIAGTPLDFRQPHRIGERMPSIKEAHFRGGYDHCLVLDKHYAGELSLCGKLVDTKSGRYMEVETTEPGVQLFSANFAGGSYTGPGGYVYPKHLGVCLETQHFPDSPNKAHFPSTVLRPGETFRSVTVLRFGVQRD
jgi:aldose 1-epimerase